jgi:hypothetical protein
MADVEGRREHGLKNAQAICSKKSFLNPSTRLEIGMKIGILHVLKNPRIV